jgi:hypothetical protein
VKRLALGLIAVVLAFGPATRFASAQPELDAAAVRFAAVDIYVDSTGPLAAWQFELTEATGAMAVVGVENGDSRAFPDAPHFDRAAVEQGRADRIIVADYSLASADQLPRGRTRVATVHVQLTGGRAPDFQLRLIAAGDPSGRPIAAEAVLELEDGSAQ